MEINKLVFLIIAILLSVPTMAQNRLEPIRKLEIGKNREFVVNGKPFFPIMSWAQPKKNYAILILYPQKTQAVMLLPNLRQDKLKMAMFLLGFILMNLI